MSTYKATTKELSDVAKELRIANPSYTSKYTESAQKGQYKWPEDYIDSIKDIETNINQYITIINKDKTDKKAIEQAIKYVLEKHNMLPQGFVWPEDLDWPTDIVNIIRNNGPDLDNDNSIDAPSYDNLLTYEENVNTAIKNVLKEINDLVGEDLFDPNTDQYITDKIISWPANVISIISGSGWDTGDETDGEGNVIEPSKHIPSFREIILALLEVIGEKDSEIEEAEEYKNRIIEAITYIISEEEEDSALKDYVLNNNDNMDWEDIVNALLGSEHGGDFYDIDGNDSDTWNDSIKGIIEELKRRTKEWEDRYKGAALDFQIVGSPTSGVFGEGLMQQLKGFEKSVVGENYDYTGKEEIVFYVALQLDRASAIQKAEGIGLVFPMINGVPQESPYRWYRNYTEAEPDFSYVNTTYNIVTSSGSIIKTKYGPGSKLYGGDWVRRVRLNIHE